MPGEVIPSIRYRHKPTGRTASIGGAAPWTSEADRGNWLTETVGFTIRHPDGTTGLGRPPFATHDEAQAWVDAHPNFPGMSQG